MATIQNARDVLLQATSPRVAAIPLPTNVTVDLSNATQAINNLPDYTRVTGVTPIATQLSLSLAGGYVTGNLPSYTRVNGLTDIATQTSLSLGGSYLSGFGTFAAINNISLTDAVKVLGNLANSRVNGLGALALLASVDLGSSTYVVGNLAANRIAAGSLAVGVTYAGVIYVDQLNAGRMTTGADGDYLDVGYVGSSKTLFNVLRQGSVNTTDPIMVLSDSSDQTNTGVALEIFTNRGTGFQVLAPKPATGVTTAATCSINGFTNNSPGALFYVTGRRPDGQVVVQATGTAPAIQAFAGSNSALMATNTHAFYATAGGYGPFTGSHDALLAKSHTFVVNGQILVDKRLVAAPSINDALYEVEVSSKPYDTRAIGVQSRRGELGDMPPAALIAGYENVYSQGEVVRQQVVPVDGYADLQTNFARITVNALGEGQIQVCGEGGDLQAGDYVATSSTPGVGMRQNLLLVTPREGHVPVWTDEADDTVRTWTVARVREPITFDGPGDVRLVPCIYLCG